MTNSNTLMQKSLVIIVFLFMVGLIAGVSNAQTAFVDIFGSTADIGLVFTDGSTEIGTFQDDDNDGIIHFGFDTQLVETFYAHTPDCIIWDILGTDVHESESIPLFMTPTGDALITLMDLSAPVGAVSIGQTFPVEQGQTSLGGLSILQHPGFSSLADLMALDFNTIPAYTGDAVVTNLVQVQVVPEPSSAVALFACSAAVLMRRRQRVLTANSRITA